MMNPSIFFISSFFVIYVLFAYSKKFQWLYFGFGDFLLKKSFPFHSHNEPYKFSFIRILFGLIIFIRSYQIHLMLISDDFNSEVWIWSIMQLIATIALTVGLFTQWALIFLIFFMWHAGDFILGTRTLGNDVGAMLGVLLFLTGAGRRISIDAIIMHKYKKIKFIFLYLYGDSASKNIALAKFAALASYWAVCVYSLSMHINEPAWTTGVAGPLLLSNNFMSAWYLQFESLFAYSTIAVAVAKYSIWAMMCWYVLILPFVLFGGMCRMYIIVWAILFFTISLVILNLGSLAEIEFLFFAAIFWTRFGIAPAQSILIFFDDRCNLCDKTIRFIDTLDVFHRIKLMPISLNNEEMVAYKISVNDAINDLHGVDSRTNKIEKGYDFYLMVARCVVLLWPLLPVLYFFKWFGLGPIIYRFIAKKRRDIFGICSITYKQQKKYENFVSEQKHNYLHPVIVLHIVFLIICYLRFLPAPYIGIPGSINMSTQAAHFYGITPIDVFNRGDLMMAENWFTIKNIHYNELIPIFTDEGVRLSMHKSDRIYFGNTLRFRRGAIGLGQCVFDKFEDKIIYLSKVYLHLKQASKGKYVFDYTQYYKSLPDTELLKTGVYHRNEKIIMCNNQFEVNYTE